jgi:hypothetical protein
MSMKTLAVHWEDAKEDWADGVRRDFDEHHWEPLEFQTSATIQAIDRLAQVLEEMERDCS